MEWGLGDVLFTERTRDRFGVARTENGGFSDVDMFSHLILSSFAFLVGVAVFLGKIILRCGWKEVSILLE